MTGATGFSGFTGMTGATGFSGFTGMTGTTGFSGQTGFTGQQGPTGYSMTGFTGQQGPQGQQGISSGLIYYMNLNNTPSPAIDGYTSTLSLLENISSSTVTTTMASNNTGVLIASFANQISNLGITTSFIPPGLWDMNIFASTDSNAANGNYISIYFSLYGRTAGGVETLLGSSSQQVVNSLTSNEYDLTLAIGYVSITSYQSLVVKVFANTTVNGSHPLTTYYTGTSNYSHIHTSFSTPGFTGATGTSYFNPSSGGISYPSTVTVGNLAVSSMGNVSVSSVISATPATTYDISGNYQPLFIDKNTGNVFSVAPSGTNKAFIIDHPVDKERYLVHVCLEGPEAGVYYRGKGEITNGVSQTVFLPDYVDALATDFTVQITPIYNGKMNNVLQVTEVADNQFEVYGENSKFYWIVHGKRNEVEVEPKKSETEVKRVGPYSWI
jgi:hypothetical protein